MDLRVLTDQDKSKFNNLVTHVTQSWEWGEFRQKLGLKVKRYGLFKDGKLLKAFQITFHTVPFLDKNVGYLPKGPFPDADLAQALTQIAQDENCISIKIEPHLLLTRQPDNQLLDNRFTAAKAMFTTHNFIIDLTLSEPELLTRMSSKTRYNIKIAQKHGVKVEERFDDAAFKIYLKLYFATTKRQGYHGHNEHYHHLVWHELKTYHMARLLIAYYQPPDTSNQIPLSAWLLLNFKDTLYYPYGGSSTEHREVMANNLVAWSAIKLGKKLGLKRFDLWGALGPNPAPKDPFLGFHRFKSGYGGELVEYLGSFDLVINKPLYILFNQINNFMFLKVLLLKLLRR